VIYEAKLKLNLTNQCGIPSSADHNVNLTCCGVLGCAHILQVQTHAIVS